MNLSGLYHVNRPAKEWLGKCTTANLALGSVFLLIVDRLFTKSMAHFRFILLPALLIAAMIPCSGDAQSSAFGSSQESEAALIGVLYDLKQTQDHQSTNVDPETYTTVMDEFLSKGWDEKVLNRYYRVSHPLYTTQIFIPNMNADKAPDAFGAQKTVKPSRWVIHYKGQISPPSAG